MKFPACVFLIIVFAQSVYGQERPCDSTFNDRSRYIKFYWANDALKLRGITDRYFTNGNSLEYYFLPDNPGFIEKLFFRMPCSSTRNNNFAVGLNIQMYTPQDITTTEIQEGDRPYAGLAYLSFKCISNEFATADRITTEYSIGVIGEYSYQKEVQTWFHELIDSDKPMGWKNQIRNDLAVNIRVDYEKGVFRPSKNLEALGVVEANFGTVTNYMGLGSIIRLGSFNDYFINELGLRAGQEKFERYRNRTNNFQTRKVFPENLRRNWQFFFFIKATGRIVIDNSLLQGGVFNYENSPYRIGSDDLNRFYLNAEFGVNVTYRGVGLIYSQHFRTAEFRSAFDAHWGSVAVIVRLR